MERLTPTQLNVWFRDRVLSRPQNSTDFCDNDVKVPLSLLKADVLEQFVIYLSQKLSDELYNTSSSYTANDFYKAILLIDNRNLLQHLYDYMES